MQAFPIRTITETDIDGIVEATGGVCTHPDADRRGEIGADYVLGATVIELKFLDEEGFDKPERQTVGFRAAKIPQHDRATGYDSFFLWPCSYVPIRVVGHRGRSRALDGRSNNPSSR